MTEPKTERLSREDQDLIARNSRSYELGRIAELVSLANDSLDQLSELWAGHERRYGPAEQDVREVVLRTLRRDR